MKITKNILSIILFFGGISMFCFGFILINQALIKKETQIEEIIEQEEDNLIMEYEQILASLNEANEIQREQINELKNQLNILQEECNKLRCLSNYTDEEWEYLCRAAAAEAGPASKEGITNVVCVILNRVNSELFPNSIQNVIKQKNQFKVYPYMFNNIEINEFIRETVFDAVYNYSDYNAQGALYFNKAKKFYDYEKLFTDEVGHTFYK